jgi:Flp pilus assembly protein CpaB
MTGGSPPVLRIGWRRSWIPPHVRRRILAALLAGAGVLLALSSLQKPAAGPRVVVAAHDLPAGARLVAGDLTIVSLPADATPAGTQTTTSALVGQVLIAAVRAHEPLTDLRLSASGSAAGLEPGLVAAPVRLADADVAPLLHPGARVDVLAAASSDLESETASAAATVVARDVLVLSVGPGGSTSASSTNTSGGTLVVLAVTRSDAQALAGGEAAGRLSVSLLGS